MKTCINPNCKQVMLDVIDICPFCKHSQGNVTVASKVVYVPFDKSPAQLINEFNGDKPVVEKKVTCCGDCPFFKYTTIDFTDGFCIVGYLDVKEKEVNTIPSFCPLRESVYKVSI